MPVVDRLAEEYSDRVDFVAPAWKSTFALTKDRADELFASGQILWGLDEEMEIFALYGVPLQPVTILIAGDKTVVTSWAGARGEDFLREQLDNLVALSG